MIGLIKVRLITKIFLINLNSTIPSGLKERIPNIIEDIANMRL